MNYNSWKAATRLSRILNQQMAKVVPTSKSHPSEKIQNKEKQFMIGKIVSFQLNNTSKTWYFVIWNNSNVLKELTTNIVWQIFVIQKKIAMKLYGTSKLHDKAIEHEFRKEKSELEQIVYEEES